MMHNWFECKIRYEKVAENGMTKKVTGLTWWMRLVLPRQNRA